MDLKTRVKLRIKAIRKHKGLTQAQLAELIGRSEDAVCNLERGVSLPSMETIQNLAEKLNVPIEDFFDIDDSSSQGGSQRARLMIELKEIARSLKDTDLDLAVKLLNVLNDKNGGN